MNCQEVREQLSAYYDGELPADKHAAVGEHVADCPDCAQELAAFTSITATTAATRAAKPPKSIWNGIEKQLDERGAAPLVETDSRRSRLTTRVRSAALAGTVLIAIGVSWFVYESVFKRDHHDHQFAAEFGEYLDEFRQNPDGAQRALVTKYEGQLVGPPEEALSHVSYRPAAAGGLPEGYTLESTYVLKMPCCTCVQTICERDDGTHVAVFEHDADDAQWFGNRPHITTLCHNQACILYELDDRIAATWKRETRYMTLVGIRDVVEVSRFVAWFDGRDQ